MSGSAGGGQGEVGVRWEKKMGEEATNRGRRRLPMVSLAVE
jgi:hypothetical protein